MVRYFGTLESCLCNEPGWIEMILHGFASRLIYANCHVKVRVIHELSMAFAVAVKLSGPLPSPPRTYYLETGALKGPLGPTIWVLGGLGTEPVLVRVPVSFLVIGPDGPPSQVWAVERMQQLETSLAGMQQAWLWA